jgi:N-acetylneuraminic acid mutarotase
LREFEQCVELLYKYAIRELDRTTRDIIMAAASSSRRRARDDDDAAPARIVLSGGHAEVSRTIDRYRREQACDAVLKSSEGEIFHVHRVILTGKSEYFEGLYSSEWADADGTVTLSQVSYDSLRCCLDWIYCGTTEVMSEQALFALLEAAVYLRIQELVTAGGQAATSRLDPSNALLAWTVAEPRPELAGLAAAAFRKACRNFSAIVADSAAWASVPRALVHALLADDRLAVTKEEDVYHAATAWIAARNPPLAASEAMSLLVHVRYARLEAHFVADVVRREPLLRTASGQQVLLDAFQAAWFGSQPPTRLGGLRGFLYVMGGRSDDVGNRSRVMERFDPKAKSWQTMPPMPRPRCDFGSALVGNKIYVVGGHGVENDVGAANTMDCYDVITETWEAMPPMSMQRVNCIAAVVDDQIYVLGGLTGGMERFDPHARTWETMPALPTQRTACSAAVVNGKLFVVGGKIEPSAAHGTVTARMDRFDPATRTWEAMPPMPTARATCATAVIAGSIYVLGGQEAHGPFSFSEAYSDSVERFVVATNEWDPMPRQLMAFKSIGPRAAALNGKIYVLGGRSTTVRHSLMEVVDTASGEGVLATWSTVSLAPTSTPTAFGAVVSVAV